jgi:hypothetical protein
MVTKSGALIQLRCGRDAGRADTFSTEFRLAQGPPSLPMSMDCSFLGGKAAAA